MMNLTSILRMFFYYYYFTANTFHLFIACKACWCVTLDDNDVVEFSLNTDFHNTIIHWIVAYQGNGRFSSKNHSDSVAVGTFLITGEQHCHVFLSFKTSTFIPVGFTDSQDWCVLSTNFITNTFEFTQFFHLSNVPSS